MQKSELCSVHALASRDFTKAHEAATKLGIPKAYGSYDELLADPDIDAIYNPLPNHLHLPWTIRAAEAGKHVLCEKPIGIDAQQVRELIAVRDRTGVSIGEAFMVRVHPQWLRARDIVRSRAMGDLRAVTGFFSYNNQDPKNIRNILEFGGGGIMDIGCYPIAMSRFLFGTEPTRVISLVERDPIMGTDRLTSAILDFPTGQATFTCSTQLVPYQHVHAFGTKGRIEIEVPFNPLPEREARIFVDGLAETFPLCDQYTLQADAFARTILDGAPVTVTLEDSLANMQVVDALFRSAATHAWEKVTHFQN
jgi:predicted dehydrogenase